MVMFHRFSIVKMVIFHRFFDVLPEGNAIKAPHSAWFCCPGRKSDASASYTSRRRSQIDQGEFLFTTDFIYIYIHSIHFLKLDTFGCSSNIF